MPNVSSNKLEEALHLKENALDEFKRILDEIVPKYETQINLEGSGEPTMAKDLDKYVNSKR